VAIKSRITTKGFSEYLEKLAGAGQDVDAVAAEALAAGGEILLAGMQRRVPKDTHNLEDHLSVDRPHQDGNFHYVDVGLDKSSDADTARYGNVQEYGSSNMPAQSYIRPTLDGDMSKARAAMKKIFIERGAL
jgi:HK97 gp10 family phage protein